MRGLNVEPEWLAGAVARGTSTLLVKAKPYAIADETFFLLNAQCALGIVALKACRVLSTVAEFRKLRRSHLISDLLRRSWARKHKNWFRGPFYVWPLTMVQCFPEPVITDAPPGPTVVINEVDVME